MKLLTEVDSINISDRLTEGMLGKLLMAVGAAILGHKTYTVIRGNKPEIEALEDFIKNAKLKEDLKRQMISIWKDLKRKHNNAQDAADEFEQLTGIRLEIK